MLNTNYTHIFIGLGYLNITSSGSIYAPRVGIYANTLKIAGIINTTGLGCASAKGTGKGRNATSSCNAGGASHGGFGGIPQSLVVGMYKADEYQGTSKTRIL